MCLTTSWSSRYPIYAGEAVGMVRRMLPAEEVIQQLGDGAERLLRGRAPGCSQSQHRRHNKEYQ